MTDVTASIYGIERHCAAAWPAVHVEEMDGWEMRFSPRSTSKRVNSLNPMVPHVGRFPDVLDWARGRCRARGVTCHIRINPLAAPECADVLTAMGVMPANETRVQIMSVNGNKTAMSDGVILETTRDQGWLDAYAEMHGDDREARQQIGSMLDQVTMKQVFASFAADGHILAVGRAACGDGLGGIFQIMTRPEARRRGFGRRIMAALLEWCGENGAKQAYLQVEAANSAACSLYGSLGFTDMYRYTYWTLPPTDRYVIG